MIKYSYNDRNVGKDSELELCQVFQDLHLHLSVPESWDGAEILQSPSKYSYVISFDVCI